MIFSLLLYYCYSTIKRLILSTFMNPLIKQFDNSFLMYIKMNLSHENSLNLILNIKMVIWWVYQTTEMKLQQMFLLLW